MDYSQRWIPIELNVPSVIGWSWSSCGSWYCLYMFVLRSSLRCSSLFSVAIEWKLHPEEVESDVCRSRLQLFSLAGGASRTDLRGSVIHSHTVQWAINDMDQRHFKWYSALSKCFWDVHSWWSWSIQELEESGKASHNEGQQKKKLITLYTIYWFIISEFYSAALVSASWYCAC